MSRWLLPAKGHNSRLTSAWLSFGGDRAYFGADRDARDSRLTGPGDAQNLLNSVLWGMMRVERVLTGLVPAWAVACAVLLASLGPCGLAAKAESPPAVAKDARVAGDRERTRFIADLSKKVDVHVFALGNPYRVIVDAPDVSFQMPDGIGKEKRGLVTAYRYGLFAPGKARIVIDVSGPFLIDKAFVLEPRDDQPARLVVDLVPTDEKTFLAKLKEFEAAASGECYAISACASSGAPRQREARGGVGPRPWRRRSGHQQRHRHHRERGRAHLRPRA